jgi:hypothetical protein
VKSRKKGEGETCWKLSARKAEGLDLAVETKALYSAARRVAAVTPARSSVFQLVPSVANSKQRSARSTRVPQAPA